MRIVPARLPGVPIEVRRARSRPALEIEEVITGDVKKGELLFQIDPCPYEAMPVFVSFAVPESSRAAIRRHPLSRRERKGVRGGMKPHLSCIPPEIL